MTDTKRKSVVEVLVNQCIAFPIAFVASTIILPTYSPQLYAASNNWNELAFVTLQVTVWFAIVSIIRQYVLRRIFDTIKGARWLKHEA